MIPGMMGQDKKGLASLIIGKDGEVKSEEKEVDSSEMGLSAAADDLMAAIKSDDSKGVKAALKSFFDMCSDSVEAEEPKEEISEEM
jgi:tRNA threonylcarbamoyladenosine modification (KEOPS) complex  Pcc1 subunit